MRRAIAFGHPVSPLAHEEVRLLPTSVPAAVSLQGVAKYFDGQPAVDGVSLDVAKGEFLAIVGPSGSGKTTLMRLIGGFEIADAGTIAIGGRDVTHTPAEQRNVNTVFQSYALFPHLTVLDNVAYGPRMRGVGRRERYATAERLLDLVSLRDLGSRFPGELSGGQQQRVALARALANEPEVLLLDEPLGALDRKLRDEMQRELRRVQAELGATFLYVTHDQEEAFGMADRLAVMRAGRFEQIGAPAEVYDAPVNAWVALFVGAANTIVGEVTVAGTFARLSSSAGRLAVGYLARGLAKGDRAIVVVRPEATVFQRMGASAEGNNVIAATLVDTVVLGASLRQRAIAADGAIFESISRRSGSGDAAGATGEPVVVTFAPEAARAYREDITGASAPLQYSQKETHR